ncbi:MAG TPA: hypothetical protein VIM17_10650 [Jatrophihabitantaceae bacterium]|jgi:hypothetical protein
MTTSMLNVRFVHASHSELLRQAEPERLVRAARAERQADRSTLRVWWRPSLRFRRRQLPQVIRPVAAL